MNSWMCEEYLFDLLRVDVLASLYDHLLRSTDQLNASVLVHRGHIAGKRVAEVN